METTAIVQQPDKVCTKCGEPKPLAEFANNGVTPDKRHPFCNPCRKTALAAGWEKRRRAAQAEPDRVDTARAKTCSSRGITEDEWWEIFHLMIAGSATLLEEIDARYKTRILEARNRKKTIKIAMERLFSAIVAMWGKPPL